MKTNIKEIRDPIHNFIHVDRDEMKLVDTPAFQRLRHIHQLALTYLVYPGATHKRFEHSLGVMELASKAFDTITSRENVDDDVRKLFPEITTNSFLTYWRKVIRVAALCHDLGHPPFSHAAEKELFPPNFNHEDLTREIVTSTEMRKLWRAMTPPIRAEDIVKLAVGKKKAGDLTFTDWEILLSEVITGDAFGVDRMDYLLRDSHHAGVSYGKFDHFRLLETLRILRPPQEDAKTPVQPELLPAIAPSKDKSREPMLGLLIGGLHSAEALLLARNFIYAQVYFHHVRIAYNFHLKEFLKVWLPSGVLPSNIRDHLNLTDNEVLAGIREHGSKRTKRAFHQAQRIVSRKHFRLARQFTTDELAHQPRLPEQVANDLEKVFNPDAILLHLDTPEGKPHKFTVRMKDGSNVSSLALSPLLTRIPPLVLGYLLVDPDILEEVKDWLNKRKVSQS